MKVCNQDLRPSARQEGAHLWETASLQDTIATRGDTSSKFRAAPDRSLFDAQSGDVRLSGRGSVQGASVRCRNKA